MSGALMIDGRALEDAAVEIIDSLREVVSVRVALFDLDEHRVHSRMSSWWYTRTADTAELAATVLDRKKGDQSIYVRINRRWIIGVASLGRPSGDDGWIVSFAHGQPLSPDAVGLAAWAAGLLARYLPPSATLSETAPPSTGGGGGSGSAELGIPAWWARKPRN